jgi:hypothetical protein
MKHPFNQQACLDRLKKEYDKYGRLIVAFDFDNTIYDFNGDGGDYSEVIELLKECIKLEFDLILFTVDEDPEKISEKVRWLVSKDLWSCKSSHFFVNASPIFSGSRKPYYNILLDDRAGLEECYNILKHVVDYANYKLSKPRE